MKINQTTLSIGNGGNVLVDTTNITPQERCTHKQHRGRSSSSSGKKIPKEKRSDGIYVDDVFTPQKKEISLVSTACQTNVCSSIPEEEEDSEFSTSPEHWEIIAEEKRKALSLLLDENKELTEEVHQLEEILYLAKQLTSLAQPLAEEDTIDAVDGITKEDIASFFKNQQSLPYSNGKQKKNNDTHKNLKQASHSSDRRTSGETSRSKSSSKKFKRKSSSENRENIHWNSLRSDKIYVDESSYIPTNIRRTKETQVQTDSSFASIDHRNVSVTAEMLTSDCVSPIYWESLVQKRKTAIDDTQRENARMKAYIKLLEEMSTEAKELAELLQSVVGEKEEF